MSLSRLCDRRQLSRGAEVGVRRIEAAGSALDVDEGEVRVDG